VPRAEPGVSPGPALPRELDDEWYRERAADWFRIQVPFLSAASCGSGGIHSRSNFEAFQHAASAQRWLSVHGEELWTQFYTPYGLELQKRFFGHFLREEDAGWTEQPRVPRQVRHVDGRFHMRHEDERPLARAGERMWLRGANGSLRAQPPIQNGSSHWSRARSTSSTWRSGRPAWWFRPATGRARERAGTGACAPGSRSESAARTTSTRAAARVPGLEDPARRAGRGEPAVRPRIRAARAAARARPEATLGPAAKGTGAMCSRASCACTRARTVPRACCCP
jgi:hypothetical protein